MAEAPKARWQPGASLPVLHKRARLLQQIRAFFLAREVLEVDTPALSAAANTDPAIDSLATSTLGQSRYLHTSPEFPMKRLLAAGSGDIYQICKVFRLDESGRYHNPEFTLLEWYRLGMDHHALMDEIAALILQLADTKATDLILRRISYRDLFLQYLQLDPLTTSPTQLANAAEQAGIDLVGALDRDGWLDLLLSHCIMPRLPAQQITLLFDYPASQAALARLNADAATAARFEVFWGDLELANGFHELASAAEQRARFLDDNRKRAARGRAEMPLDERLLAALEHGLPECSGVALGLDRLMMKLGDLDDLDHVLAFSLQRA